MPDDDNARAEFYLPGVRALQREEMWEMVHGDDFDTALVTGCAGSGKTTISIYRLIRMNNQGERVRLLTYQNMLVAFIRNCVVNNRTVLEDDTDREMQEDRVTTFHTWFCRLCGFRFNIDSPPSIAEIHHHFESAGFKKNAATELLIDEGQDLPLWIYEVLPAYYRRFFASADPAQQLRRDLPLDHVHRISQTLNAGSRKMKIYPLEQNFRNTYETYCFARQFLPRDEYQGVWDKNIVNRLKAKNRHGRKPMVIPYTDSGKRNEHMRKVLENASGVVGILCPLGPRQVANAESAADVHNLLKDWGREATLYYNKEDIPIPADLKRHIVTTYISAKGLEFDTVIIPRINFYKNPLYYKTTILNELYVACTRAKSHLYIYRDMKNPQFDPIGNFDPETYETSNT